MMGSLAHGLDSLGGLLAQSEGRMPTKLGQNRWELQQFQGPSALRHWLLCSR